MIELLDSSVIACTETEVEIFSIKHVHINETDEDVEYTDTDDLSVFAESDEAEDRNDQADCDTNDEHDHSVCSRVSIPCSISADKSQPSTMDHEQIRNKAYTVLLSTSSNSVNINRFTTSFEEEGLIGMTFGMVQILASEAMKAIEMVSRTPNDNNIHRNCFPNQIIVLQFAGSLAAFILQALGISKQSRTGFV